MPSVIQHMHGVSPKSARVFWAFQEALLCYLIAPQEAEKKAKAVLWIEAGLGFCPIHKLCDPGQVT